MPQKGFYRGRAGYHGHGVALDRFRGSIGCHCQCHRKHEIPLLHAREFGLELGVDRFCFQLLKPNKVPKKDNFSVKS